MWRCCRGTWKNVHLPGGYHWLIMDFSPLSFGVPVPLFSYSLLSDQMKMQHLQSYQCNLVMPSSESAISAQSSAYWKSCSKVVIHLDCGRRRARLKSDPFERKRIETPEGESEKTCINIAAANMTKRVGARMHPCLTPLLYAISLVSSLSTKILTLKGGLKRYNKCISFESIHIL